MNDSAYAVNEALDPRVSAAWDDQYRNPKASMQQALAVLSAAPDSGHSDRTRAWAHLCIAYYKLRYESPTAAAAELDAAEGFLNGSSDGRARMVLGNGRARQMAMEGNIGGAIRLFTANLASTDAGIASLDRCQALNGLAGCHWEQGDWAQSLAHSFEALNLMRYASERHHLVALLNNVGVLLVTVGDFDTAQRLLREGIAIARDFVHPGLQQVLRAALIHCELDSGKAAQALPLVDEIRAFGEVASESSDAGEIIHAVAEAFIANRRWQEAEAELDAASALLTSHPKPELLAANTWLRGLLAYRQGQLRPAIELLTAAIGQLGEVTLPSVTCRAYRLLADAEAEAGDFEKAYQHHAAFFRHHEARLGIASRAHYHALTVRHELEQTREAAVRDGLTGLYNRAYLDSVLEKLVAMSKRSGAPLCLAMIDLDHFKRVNDGHGHIVGDAVLTQLARLIRSSVRASDIACRYGGEEFCLILPNTPLAEAATKLDVLLQAWRTSSVVAQDVAINVLTFSAGVAELHETDASATALLRLADERLYCAKNGGRNRVHGGTGL